MTAYLPLIPVLILFLTCAVLIILRFARPEFAYSWLIASSGALLAWLLVLLSRSNIPHTISIFPWGTEQTLPYNLQMSIDQFSWPYAFALATRVLSLILTDVVRPDNANWFVWSSNLLLGALGILAVEAGNPYTLLLMWMAIDLTVVFVLLREVSQNDQRERVVIAFAARAAGTLLLVWAILSTINSGISIDFDIDFNQIPNQTSLLLLFSAVLRMGVVPLHQPILQEVDQRRNLGTTIRLVLAAAGLILLTRTANVGFQGSLSPYIIVISGIAALFAAVAWVASRDELQGRSYWILGIGTFAFASAVRAEPLASLAWGVMLILSGGLLFLVSTRNRLLYAILMLGGVSVTTLPYTQGWGGVLLYVPDFEAPLVFFLIAQSFFLAGYLRHVLPPAPPLSGLERWVRVIYPWGLALLPASQFIIGGFGWQAELTLLNVMPGILVCLLTVIWITLYHRLNRRPKILQFGKGMGDITSRIISTRWFYRLIGRVYVTIERSLSFIVAVLEGDGGVLWALFFLVLFIAILTQYRIGG